MKYISYFFILLFQTGHPIKIYRTKSQFSQKSGSSNNSFAKILNFNPNEVRFINIIHFFLMFKKVQVHATFQFEGKLYPTFLDSVV